MRTMDKRSKKVIKETVRERMEHLLKEARPLFIASTH